jgi:NADPH:quinone reductase-like Zn-dependent oxidoreductase
VPAENVFPKPSHLSHEEAAAIPLGALTAYRALVTRGEIREGETVVVPGIGSGVATFVVQMAAALGARVYVTSGNDEKLEKAKELGAEDGVNYKSENWSKELKGMIGGADLSVDHVGGEAFDALVSLAKPGTRIVTFGATAGPKVSVVMPRIFLKHLTVLGTAMGTNEEFGAMLDLWAEHGLRPTINETFPLEDTSAAMKHMEEGTGMGKIVLDIPA